MQTFDSAKLLHLTLREAARDLKKKSVEPEPVWNAIMDPEDDPADDTFAEALRLTMPADSIPIVRTLSGVAAAFVMHAAAAIYEPNRDLMKLARDVWKAFEERRALAELIQHGYGCDKAASWECAREMAESQDVEIVRSIADMAGRMYEVLSGVRKIPTDDPHEVKGVTVGGDIERLVGEEISALSTPGLSDLAAIRILEKRATQYKYKGKMAKSRGPLVICIDESGSMADDGYAGRNTWAKSCAVAMTRVAHEGDRMVKVVHFATSCVVTECAPGDAKAVLDMSRHFLDGGTDIADALYNAAREVGNLAMSGHVGADIVMITDGVDNSGVAQEKILGLVQAQGVRLWTVAIECEIPLEMPLRKRASDYVRVGATDRAELMEALRGVANNEVSDEEVAAAEQARIAAMN